MTALSSDLFVIERDGVHYNITAERIIELLPSPDYGRYSNSDGSTNLSASTTWAAAPVFGTVEKAWSDFTVNGAGTILTAARAGSYSIYQTVSQSSSTARAGLDMKVDLNGTTVSGVVGTSYIRALDNHNNDNLQVYTRFDVEVGDEISILMRMSGKNPATITQVIGWSSTVIERKS